MTQIELLVKLGRYGELIDLIKQTISRYLETNIDLTFVFLKAVNKKLNQIRDKQNLPKIPPTNPVPKAAVNQVAVILAGVVIAEVAMVVEAENKTINNHLQ